MSKPVIEVNNISVKYLVGDLRNIGLKEFFMKKVSGKYRVQSFMAVDGVSFVVNQGDMLGIIGTNGAGKSTLLKIITKIMVPSTGTVKVNGNIAALLELSSGFDGDLNVKENAYLRGAMLGYTREFMDKKYPEILEFSELREFEERPFKQLSSGMKSRIAFSIASMVEPEILILDEVLSVGDGAFREKSEAKMKEIIQNGKVTILVSHSIPQIRKMCNKVLWLHRGKQMAFGEANAVCDRYENFLKTGALPEIK
jgi:ABC-2 type transport system ATP-binding protein